MDDSESLRPRGGASDTARGMLWETHPSSRHTRRMHRAPLLIVANRRDPLLEQIALTVYELFPDCVRCGQRIVRLEEADVRVFRNRLVHRGTCPGSAGGPGAPA